MSFFKIACENSTLIRHWVFAVICFSIAIESLAVEGNIAPTLTPTEANIQFSLKVPGAKPVSFHGMSNGDGSGGGTGAMMYPAPNLIGFLAAIATHAALQTGVASQQQSEQQAKADKILEPYRDVLIKFTNKELLQEALVRLNISGGRAISSNDSSIGQRIVIESVPEFMLSSDRGALILDNAIVMYSANDPTKIIYRNIIRVVSSPRNVDQATKDVASDVVQTDAALLVKAESISLYAHSMKLAIDINGSSQMDGVRPSKTFRYQLGSKQQFERGEMVAEYCERTVIKTLRGWLMSVPNLPSLTDAEDSSKKNCIGVESGVVSPRITLSAS